MKAIIKDIFGIEGAFVDELVKQNTDIVFVGELKDSDKYTVGTWFDEIVSIESVGLLKMLDTIKMILEE